MPTNEPKKKEKPSDVVQIVQTISGLIFFCFLAYLVAKGFGIFG